jgi:hypothetical protein
MSINPLKLRKNFSRAALHLASPRFSADNRGYWKFFGSAAWRGGGSQPKKPLLAIPTRGAACLIDDDPLAQSPHFPVAFFHLSAWAPAKDQGEAMQPLAVLHSLALWLSYTLMGNSL